MRDAGEHAQPRGDKALPAERSGAVPRDRENRGGAGLGARHAPASAVQERPGMKNNTTFEAIPFNTLETVAGGVGATRKKPATTQPAQQDVPASLFKGCLTGAAGGILGGPHGAAIGCAVGAGKSFLDAIGSQLGVPTGSTSTKKQ